MENLALVLCHSDTSLSCSVVPGHTLISQRDAPSADRLTKRARWPSDVQTAAAWSSFTEDRSAMPAGATCQRETCRAATTAAKS
ncbi:hypothetical protein CesoFtcFv8_015468 [Champsocephalus esox]|uniref:Uncharacterized protein n=1 Tax=Champsocephalus esox TaxID=159716 RepID=A0AAN8BQQ4_9TELE|nr:hypothetical protein CesoFtcFv8_015468 [Champsocephalus esox]